MPDATSLKRATSSPQSVGRITLPKLMPPPPKLAKIDPELHAWVMHTQGVFNALEEKFNALQDSLRSR